MSAVANPQPTNSMIIPEAEERAIIAFDNTLTSFRNRLDDPGLSDMMRTHIQAKAILAIESMITPAMMADFKALMNSPLGFKTDRAPGAKDRDGKQIAPYSDETVKRCVIVALLSGAKLTGDEFNIIAGQCYLTKKFLRPAILRFPGLTDLETLLGTPNRHGDRTAVIEAIARWKVNGREFEIKCTKGDIDSRIVVNSYSTSSPDELIGKAERKLYARIWARLTGLNTESDEESVPTPGTIDSTAMSTPVDPAESAELDEDRKTANAIFLAFASDIDKLLSVDEVRRAAEDRHKLIATSEWSDELRQTATDEINNAARRRCDEVRPVRGERSNPRSQREFA